MSSGSPIVFDTNTVEDFYKNYICNPLLLKIYEENGFSPAGTVHFRTWEVFASQIIGETRKPGNGSDFANYEVKSAVKGNSFEYQYHKNTGLAKLEEDMKVSHMFMSYSPDYSEVSVRVVPPTQLVSFFESWKSGLAAAYSEINPKQRYRRSIPYGTVQKLGTEILAFKDGVRAA